MERPTEAPHKSRASVALGERFKPKRSGNQKRCSDRTGIDQSRLSKLASGEVQARADEAVKIQREEGIPVAWWADKLTGEEPAPASERNPTPGKVEAS